MKGDIYIGDIDKMQLLKKLWENAIPKKGSSFEPVVVSIFQKFMMDQVFPPPDPSFLKNHIDYYEGRSIKCDISGKKARPFGYNMDYGEGEFERIVNELRAESSKQLK